MRNQPPDFANVVLDSLTTHIAVLDERGVIIGVNDAWRRFAEANHGESSHHYVGQNYLAVCESAALCGADETIAALLEGLKSVLSGERTRFALEYPCHSPDEERWFTVSVTPCNHGRESWVVVAHEDITARKKAEIALARTQVALEQANRDLQVLARTDGLTGLCNRRHFFSLAEQLFKIASRYATPLSVVLLDVDHFKKINDTCGHQAGDEALKKIAGRAASQLRAADVIARYGGEELVLLLPETTAEQAFQVVESVRRAVATRPVLSSAGSLHVTLSAGIAQMAAREESIEAMMRRADGALYEAKASGRNCCRVSRIPG
jgi:diguanylate cyclase (GGDEF)-like protein/PAS domain S-box-containing protein